jgi:hypothetical protein
VVWTSNSFWFKDYFFQGEFSMSHKTSVDTQFLDQESVKKTIEELGGTYIEAKEVNLFEGRQECDYAVQLRGWRYPVAIKDGVATFDNYEGRWGSQESFNEFRQKYAENVTLKQAQTGGFRVLSRNLTAEGTIQLRLGR